MALIAGVARILRKDDVDIAFLAAPSQGNALTNVERTRPTIQPCVYDAFVPFEFRPVPDLPPVVEVIPEVFSDERGRFLETYKQSDFAAHGIGPFVQDNQSLSVRGVVRGLHYQLDPHAQGKLVRVVVGEVFDVAVDLRQSSRSFGAWVGRELTASRGEMLWVPPGFGHGFMALSDQAVVAYKTTREFAGEAERSVRWDDPTLAIDWPDPGVALILSRPDAGAPRIGDAEVFR